MTRSSDTLGRVGATEFAILAPATDGDGAERLARRVTQELETKLAESGERRVGFHIGVDAVANMAYAPINAIELLGRANLAERRARGTPGGRPPDRFKPGSGSS